MVMEATDRLLSGTDPVLVRVVQRRLEQLGVTVKTNTTIQSAQIDEQGAVVTTNEGEVIEADVVLVTVGRVPNTDGLDLAAAGVTVDASGLVAVDARLRSQNPRIAAIGDITPGPMLAHKASYQGKVAAESLCGQASVADAIAIPAVIFTDPEIASVGYSEDEARQLGYETVTGRFSFAANGRALSLDEPRGFVEVVADASQGILLGLHAVGPDASSLIGEGGLALEMGATLEDLALTIHAHPTLPEVWMEAAEQALGRPIHIAPRRR